MNNFPVASFNSGSDKVGQFTQDQPKRPANPSGVALASTQTTYLSSHDSEHSSSTSYYNEKTSARNKRVVASDDVKIETDKAQKIKKMLHNAISSGDIEGVNRVFGSIKSRNDKQAPGKIIYNALKEKDKNNMTLFVCAVKSGNVDMVETLLGHVPSDKKVKFLRRMLVKLDESGSTPLMMTAHRGNEKNVEMPTWSLS